VKKQDILSAIRDRRYDSATSRALVEALTKHASDVPLSTFQLGIWTVQRGAPDAIAYNVPIVLRGLRPLDVDALRLACLDLTLRFPILTSTIQDVAAGPVRRPYSAAPPECRHVNGRGFDEQDLFDEITASRQARFDLQVGPLWRLTAIETGDDAWVLVLVIHHVIYDGASAMVLADRLMRFHDARAAGMLPEIVDVEDMHAHFAREQARWLETPEAGTSLEFWRAQLGNEPPVLDIPLDRPRPLEQRFRGSVHELTLDPALASMADAAAARLGVTRATWFLGVFQVLLSGYSGQDDVIVGIPVSLRPGDMRDTVGNFLNIVPLRTDVDHSRSFAQHCARIQASFSKVREHAAYPLAELVKRLDLPRVASMSPVFQIIFAYQNFGSASDEAALASAHRLDIWPVQHQTGESDLGLEVFQRESGSSINVKYNTDLFDPATIRRMADRYMHLLASLSADPDRPLSRFELATPDEIKQIDAWNATDVHFEPEETLLDLFTRSVEEHPSCTAVTANGHCLTYAALRERVDAIGAALGERGIGPGDRVGVCMSRSVDLLATLLGIMASGAAYVPLDPRYPVERIQAIASDSGLRTMLTDAASRSSLAAAIPDSYEVSVVADLLAQGGTTVVPGGSLARPSALAYVIYTSGSTGTPKGVMVSHASLANLLISMRREPGLRPRERLLALATYAFDMSVPELYLPLVVGAECLLGDEDIQREPARLIATIAQERPALMQATPTTCGMLFEAGWRNAEGVTVLVGAEPLTASVHEALMATGTRAWNMYGPTETTVWSTMGRLVAGGGITVGSPMINTQVHILDRHGRRQPPGIYGELCIGGRGVAEGYFGRASLTAEKFPLDMFSNRGGARLYRTGDMARWRDDGQLEFAGRTDFQVKIRGYRIELGEIEEHLRSHPAVMDAVVVVNQHYGQRRLIAYVVCHDTSAADTGMREWLRGRLPAYMLPSFFVALEQLPLTPNGKIDRLSLAERPMSVRAVEARVTPSGDADLERKVLDIWREALGVDSIDPTEGFFDAGGDSVSAVVAAAAIEREFGTPFAPSAFFRHPSARDIAAHVTSITASRSSAGQTDVVDPAEATDQRLAIVGIALRVPGADDSAAYWRNLVQGVESVVAASGAGRIVGEVDGRRLVGVRSTIADKHRFDAEFFAVSSKDAEQLPPAARLLIQHAWQCMEDAGYLPSDLPDTAVYVSANHAGVAVRATDEANDGVLVDPADYVDWILEQGGTIPTLISHRLGFTGPSMYVHSNCSSSLSALQVAARAIASGDARQALVAAATVFPDEKSGYIHQPGLNFSSDGHVRPFDAEADGMVPGEGVIVILVKRAVDAFADGDDIYALIRGVGVNNDGARKAGYYAPSTTGQRAVIADVLQRTQTDVRDVVYVEAHGTGTLLGDPVEVRALTEAFDHAGLLAETIGLGAVKGNLGHLDTAAGLAGLVKVALALRHGEVPPTVNFRRPNPQLELQHSPFYIVDRAMRLPVRAKPWVAAVSAFGVGGTNAHAILEQAAPRMECEATEEENLCVLPLSGFDAEGLSRRAGDLRRYLENPGERRAPLAAIGWTLRHGRRAMAHRAVVVASSIHELSSELARIERGKSPTERATGDARMDARIGDWLAGREVNWGDATVRGRRLHLPPYRFGGADYLPPPFATRNRHVHPLVQNNVSSFGGVRFRSRLIGSEPFLRDHVVHGRPVLPGAAYLEMIVEAAARAFGAGQGTSALPVITDLTWLRPFQINGDPLDVDIALDALGEDHAMFAIRSPNGEEVYCKGNVLRGKAIEPVDVDWELVRSRFSVRCFDPSDYDKVFAGLGLRYGDSHRCLRAAWRDEMEVLARLELDGTHADDRMTIHPGMLDGAFQASLALRPLDDAREGAPVPFALARMEIHGRYRRQMWAHIRAAEGIVRSPAPLDIDLRADDGTLIVRIEGLASRHLTRHDASAGVLRAGQCWRPCTSPSTGGAGRSRQVLLLGSLKRTSDIATAMQRLGIACDRIAPGFSTGDDDFAELAGRVLTWLQESVGNDPAAMCSIQLVALAMSSAEVMALSAMLRTACLERPTLQAQVLAISEDDVDVASACIEAESAVMDPLVRYANRVRYVSELVEMTDAIQPEVSVWRRGGVYLVTGGAGGIGRRIIESIDVDGVTVESWGRSDPALPISCPRGVDVEHRVVDVSSGEAVAAGIRRILEVHGRLDGILHCAGVLDDSYLGSKSPSSFASVLAPKVAGTMHLDRETADIALDYFVMFSSIAGILGSPGQIDYSAANAFQTGFAHDREAAVAAGRRRGKTIAIAWPRWDAGGMTMIRALQTSLWQKHGMAAISTPDAIAMLKTVLAGSAEAPVVFAGDGLRLRAIIQAYGKPPSTPTIPAIPTQPDPQGNHMVPSTVLLAGSNNSRVVEHVESLVKRALAQALRIEPDRLDATAELERYGIDSIIVLGINDELEKHFTGLPKTLLFEHRTIRSLATHLAQAHPQTARRLVPVAAPVPAVAHRNHAAAVTGPSRQSAAPRLAPGISFGAEGLDVAIVGLAGRYAAAENMDQFWANLRAGRDCITEVPGTRWDHQRYFHPDKGHPGTTYTKWGGFIEDIDCFDSGFFNISPREAAILDPQERLFLQTVHEAIEDAGYTRHNLARANETVGVYVGVMYQEYQLYGAQATALGKTSALSSSPSAIANRVSYFCDFHGPSMAVDTMCSASLTAIHLACQSIRLGECAVAVAGGVNLHVHPNKYLLLSFGRFASTKGRCESFAEGGDGYVPGEGVGAVVLKPLAAAVADGDHIYGVIRGSAINHGGKTNGFSVPNPRSQSDVIRQALEQAGVSADAISYVEAHGTGTALGDPIEIRALAEAYAATTGRRQFCPIGSVKSNVGHCESAAGMAALSKVLLQLQYDELVPSLHAATTNPHIDFASTPFYLQDQLIPWARPADRSVAPRVCAISSFGAGGSNAHLIVEEYVTATAADADRRPAELVVLSARTVAQLRDQARRLRAWLEARPEGARLQNLAFTLQVGRERFSHRLALEVSSFDDLAGMLAHFLHDRIEPGMYSGQPNGEASLLADLAGDAAFRGAIAQWASEHRLDRIAALWIQGFEPDWTALHEGHRPVRISLPTYPFERERHWGVAGIVAEAEARRPRAWMPLEDARLVALPGAVVPARAELHTRLRPLAEAEGSPPFPPSPARPVIHLTSLVEPLSTRKPAELAAAAHAIVQPRVARTSHDQQVMPFLMTSLAETLMQEPGRIDLDVPFVDLGVDSILAIEWLARVNAHFQVAIPATAIYDHPTLRRFAKLLGEALPLVDTSTVQAPTRPVVRAVRPLSPSRDDLVQFLCRSLADALYLEVARIELDRPYVEMGLDSIVGVEWTHAVNAALGTSLSVATIYDYPTIRAMAAHIESSSTFVREESSLLAEGMSVDHVLAAVEAGTMTPEEAEKRWESLFEEPIP
jgi:polyketide synthase PksJ